MMIQARSGSLVVLAAVVLLMMPPAHGQSGWGHPWVRHGGSDYLYDRGHERGNHPGFYNSGYHRYEGDQYYNDYFQQRAPCPSYQPLQLSEWRMTSGQSLSLDVALPNVRSQDTHASLSRDGSTIEVKAWRLLPHRGRACLPLGARISGDGRYEILGAEVGVPDIAEGQGATMRQLRGGMRIIVPLRSRTQASEWPRERVHARHDRVHAEAHQRTAASPSRPSRASKDADTSSRSGLGEFNPLRSARSTGASEVAPDARIKASRGSEASPHKLQPLMRRAVDLPSSSDILVEDAPYPWPEKSADASEGWLDNRGEFQFY